ncbi:MAG: hypothetical protein DHS20C10_08090 [marine bacterium B5-7]|nr:MAG: hypothetical protein DHS20C10_08090 [marine bacterium B5-7]
MVYDRCHMTCSPMLPERESVEYGACSFELNDLKVRFRVGKVTPTKIGQFVTVWKRVGRGPIQPYDASDAVDFFVITTKVDDKLGQFVFPKAILIEKDIFSVDEKGGKRGFRVYPPWDKAENKQAKKTQEWQLNYFLDMSQDGELDKARVSKLYTLHL